MEGNSIYRQGILRRNMIFIIFPYITLELVECIFTGTIFFSYRI